MQKSAVNRQFDRLYVWLAKQLGYPRTFVVFAGIIASAVAVGCVTTWRENVNLWGGALTGYVGVLLLLILQNGQSREAAASQAKLDELIHAVDGARNVLIRAEELSADEIERLRKMEKV